MTPSSAVALVAMLSQLRRGMPPLKFDVQRPGDEEVHSWLTRINFYDLLRVNQRYPYSKWPSIGRFQEIVNVGKEAKAEEVARNLHAIFKKQSTWAPDVASQLTTVLSEIMGNVFHHADADEGALICAQTYPLRNAIEFAVADTGRGVAASLAGNPAHADIRNLPVQALERAMQPRATGRPASNSGWGLKWAAGAIERNGGEMLLYSGPAVYRVTSEGGQAASAPNWPGTLVAMRFRTDRSLMLREVMDALDPKGADIGGFFESF